MIRVLVILCLASRGYSEMQTYQHQTYITRKSRSNSHPIRTGFVYSRVSKAPALITTFDNLHEKPTDTYEPIINQGVPDLTNRPNTSERQRINCTGNEHKHGSPVSYKQNEERAKAETKCPSLKEMKADEDHSRPVKNYEPSVDVKESFVNYGAKKEFRIDDEDLRTGSRNTFNGWPYFYQRPDNYQSKGVVTTKKAKDKRFLGADTSIIPVHKAKNDIGFHRPVRPISNSVLFKPITTDNPIYGNEPFFSFVLNDYFDRNHDEDRISFNDFPWSEEFHYGSSYQDDNRIPYTRSEYKYPKKRQEGGKSTEQIYNAKEDNSELINMKSYDSNQGYDKHKKGDERKDHEVSKHGYEGRQESGFKNFVDFFANKFGSENNNKNSKLNLQQNQDKGEKKKGFRRVYHKDEYQEDNEFYDNTHKKAQAEENGGNSVNAGGSHAVLQSNAFANVGNEGKLYTRVGGSENKVFENNDAGNDKTQKFNSEINHYKDIAKSVALSNNADYIDNLKTKERKQN